MSEISQTELRIAARKEWVENLKLDRVAPPSHPWEEDLWLDYLAARTEYIVRQLSNVIVNYDYNAEAQEAHRIAKAKNEQQS